uniref:Uncharacterized protein n=1 Tax=Otolemur garnettii TaxID=30611 RepID=H0XS64_OTOGA
MRQSGASQPLLINMYLPATADPVGDSLFKEGKSPGWGPLSPAVQKGNNQITWRKICFILKESREHLNCLSGPEGYYGTFAHRESRLYRKKRPKSIAPAHSSAHLQAARLQSPSEPVLPLTYRGSLSLLFFFFLHCPYFCPMWYCKEDSHYLTSGRACPTGDAFGDGGLAKPCPGVAVSRCRPAPSHLNSWTWSSWDSRMYEIRVPGPGGPCSPCATTAALYPSPGLQPPPGPFGTVAAASHLGGHYH